MQQLQADATDCQEATSGEPGGLEAPVGEPVVPELEIVQDQSTFSMHLMTRVAALSEVEAEKDVVWRWTFPDQNYLLLFTALARKFGLEVFKTKGTRGHTLHIRGPRNVIWEMKKYVWDPLADTIRMAIRDYFGDVVFPEAGLDSDMTEIAEVNEKIKPSRIETEK